MFDHFKIILRSWIIQKQAADCELLVFLSCTLLLGHNKYPVNVGLIDD